MVDPRAPRWRISAANVLGWLNRRRWRLVALIVVLALPILYPFAGGAIAARVAADKLRGRLGTQVRIGGGRAGLFGLTFKDVELGNPGPAVLAHVSRLRVPFSAAFLRKGTVVVEGATVNVRRGGPDDNVATVLAALRARKPGDGAAASSGGGALPAVAVRDLRLTLKDAATGVAVEVRRIDCLLAPGDRLDLKADGIDGVLALGSTGKGPKFGAESIAVAGPLKGMKPRGYPTLMVTGGYATPMPTLSLTGIHGKIHPAAAAPGSDPADVKQLVIDLDGSYGGAKETLWTARGGLDPSAHEGQVSLRAERFSLGEIADVLPKTLLNPQGTTVDAAFDVSWAEGAVRFGGDMKVAGLSFEHPKLASEPVLGLDVGLILRGTAFPASVGSSRVDLQACKLEYSIVSPK